MRKSNSGRYGMCHLFGSIPVMAIAMAMFLGAATADAQTVRTWTGSSGGAWLTVGNWTGSIWAGDAPLATPAGEGTATDIFTTAAANTASNIGINFNTLKAAGGVGLIMAGMELNRTGTTALQIGNSSTTVNGILQLNGATLNSVANTLIRVTGNANLTIANVNSGAGTQTMGLRLGIDGGIFNVDTSRTLAISSIISDNGSGYGFSKTGAGTMVLSGANAYTGATTVSAGTMRFATQTSLYNNNTANWTDTKIIVESGSTAAFNVGGTGEFTSADIDTLKALGTVAGGFKSGAFLGLDTTNAGGTFTYSSNITDVNAGANVLGFVKLGTGTLILSGSNSYTGGTTISAGTLQFSSGALGSLGAITMNGGALQWAAGNTEDVSSRLVMVNGVSASFNTNGNNVTLATGFGGGTTGGLTKNGAGTLSVSNVNFSGAITAVGGTIQMDSIPNGTGKIAYNGGTVTFIGSSNSTCDRLIQIGTVGGGLVANLGNDSAAATLDMTNTGAITNGGTLTAGAGLKLQGSNTGDNYFRSQIIDLSSIGIKFTKDGAGKWILTNSTNSYSGGTTLNAGTLAFESGALGTGAITMNGGTLRWNGTNTQDLSSKLTMVSGATATLDTNGNDVTLATAFGGSTTGALTKIGAGKLTLSGANTYTGATTVNAGTLQLDGSLASSITVANGAQVQGTGATTGGLIVDGTVAAGNSIGALGASTELSFNATSTLVYELDASATLGEDSGDLLYTLGTLSIADGAVLTLQEVNPSALLTAGEKLTLISYGGGAWNGNLFTYNGSALADDSTFTLGANTWKFDYNDATGGSNKTSLQAGAGNFVTMMVVIPEPGTISIVGAFLASALLSRRRSLFR